MHSVIEFDAKYMAPMNAKELVLKQFNCIIIGLDFFFNIHFNTIDQISIVVIHILRCFKVYLRFERFNIANGKIGSNDSQRYLVMMMLFEVCLQTILKNNIQHTATFFLTFISRCMFTHRRGKYAQLT